MKVCVFASSRDHEEFEKVAYELGKALAAGGHLCINGGGNYGCMGALNRGCKDHGGKITCVIHHKWVVDGHEYTEADNLIVTKGDNLQERKRLLWESADCIIVLPGGTGTWDELWEVACHKGVGFGNIPICVINCYGFYNGFAMQLGRAFDENLLYTASKEKEKAVDEVFHIEENGKSALDWCDKEVKRLGTESHSHKPAKLRASGSLMWQSLSVTNVSAFLIGSIIGSYITFQVCSEGQRVALRSNM